MNTVVVWVMVAFVHYEYMERSINSVVIDNIDSYENCRRAGEAVVAIAPGNYMYRCIAVRKAR